MGKELMALLRRFDQDGDAVVSQGGVLLIRRRQQHEKRALRTRKLLAISDKRWKNLVFIGGIKPPIVDGHTNYRADPTVGNVLFLPGFCK